MAASAGTRVVDMDRVNSTRRGEEARGSDFLRLAYRVQQKHLPDYLWLGVLRAIWPKLMAFQEHSDGVSFYCLLLLSNLILSCRARVHGLGVICYGLFFTQGKQLTTLLFPFSF